MLFLTFSWNPNQLYIIDNTFLEDAPDLDVMYNAYKNIITKADLDFEDIVEEIKIESINNSTKAAVIIFKGLTVPTVLNANASLLQLILQTTVNVILWKEISATTDSWFFCFINTNLAAVQLVILPK